MWYAYNLRTDNNYIQYDQATCWYGDMLPAFERDSKHSNGNSNHSKGIRSIQLQIRTIKKGFIAFECKFEPLKRDSKHSGELRTGST